MLPNTFGIESGAKRFVVVHSEEELREFVGRYNLSGGATSEEPLLIVGAGSNMVFTRDYPGTVLHMANKGIRLLEDYGQGTDSARTVFVEAAAGEVWDDFVRHCIAQGWYGAENLVAIPGTVGAAPVQNVGAYGKEAKDIIHQVHTVDTVTGETRDFSNEECRFGYRNSFFKSEEGKRYVVVSVVFRLQRDFTPDLSYKALREAVASRGLSSPTPEQLADLIAEVRWSKLPRPEETGSAGSFFKNPVVPVSQYEALKVQYPDLVAFAVGDGYKLAAGWLIERAGWKGRTLGRCGVYEKQALVLVNRGGCTGAEVVLLADSIIADVKEKFGVTLVPEAIIVN